MGPNISRAHIFTGQSINADEMHTADPNMCNVTDTQRNSLIMPHQK